MATALPRMVFGKISEINTQQIGPHDIMKNAAYTITENTGRIPLIPMLSHIATANAPTAIPIEPIISNGLRPKRSTVKIATSVNTMFTIPMITVCIMPPPSAPALSKIRGA